MMSEDEDYVNFARLCASSAMVTNALYEKLKRWKSSEGTTITSYEFFDVAKSYSDKIDSDAIVHRAFYAKQAVMSRKDYDENGTINQRNIEDRMKTHDALFELVKNVERKRACSETENFEASEQYSTFDYPTRASAFSRPRKNWSLFHLMAKVRFSESAIYSGYEEKIVFNETILDVSKMSLLVDDIVKNIENNAFSWANSGDEHFEGEKEKSHTPRFDEKYYRELSLDWSYASLDAGSGIVTEMIFVGVTFFKLELDWTNAVSILNSEEIYARLSFEEKDTGFVFHTVYTFSQYIKSVTRGFYVEQYPEDGIDFDTIRYYELYYLSVVFHLKLRCEMEQRKPPVDVIIGRLKMLKTNVQPLVLKNYALKNVMDEIAFVESGAKGSKRIAGPYAPPGSRGTFKKKVETFATDGLNLTERLTAISKILFRFKRNWQNDPYECAFTKAETPEQLEDERISISFSSFCKP